MMLKLFFQPILQNAGCKGKKILGNNMSRKVSNLFFRSYKPFVNMIEGRKAEAKKSILIQMKSEKSVNSILKLCSTFGDIKFAGLQRQSCRNLSTTNKSNVKKSEECQSEIRHNVIIEFEEQESINKLLEEVKKTGYCTYMNANIPFLHFNNQNEAHVETEKVSNIILVKEDNLNEKEIIAKSAQEKTFSDEIQYFYDAMKLNEVGSRIRFLVCRKVELCAPLSMSHCTVLPFGSSINTFGRYDCDVDMNISIESPKSSVNNGAAELLSSSFQHNNEKYEVTNINDKSKKNYITSVLSLMMSSMQNQSLTFCKPDPIFTASVPIIKCTEPITGTDCDLTAFDDNGMEMSHLLYLYGCFDNRVRPLVFFIRQWGKMTKLSRSTDFGRPFSNFTITSLVLFYLMNKKNPIIPSINVLRVLLGEADYDNDLEFKKKTNQDSLETLFCNFFKYYDSFNFKDFKMSLVTGYIQENQTHWLHIENPIKRPINMTKNVSKFELLEFQNLCKATLMVIEQSSDGWKKVNQDQSRLSYIIDNLITAFEQYNKEKESRNDVTYLFNEEKIGNAIKEVGRRRIVPSYKKTL